MNFHPCDESHFPKFLSSCMRRLFWGIDRASLPWLTFHLSPFPLLPSVCTSAAQSGASSLPSRLLSPPPPPLSSSLVPFTLPLSLLNQPPPSFLSFLLPFRRGAFAGIALFSALPLCLASRLSDQLFEFAPQPSRAETSDTHFEFCARQSGCIKCESQRIVIY